MPIDAEKFKIACGEVANQFADGVRSLRKKMDEIEPIVKAMELEKVENFSEIYDGIGYAYVDSEDQLILVVGFEETVEDMAKIIGEAFQAQGQDFFASKFKENIGVQEMIYQEIQAQLEKMTDEDISISENWEFSPACTRFEIYSDLDINSE
jgi:hypothetical protein